MAQLVRGGSTGIKDEGMTDSEDWWDHEIAPIVLTTPFSTRREELNHGSILRQLNKESGR